MNKFDTICDRQRKNYIHDINIEKQRLNYYFRKGFLYKDFIVFVISFILKKIYKYYKRLLKIQKKKLIYLYILSILNEL